MTPTPGQNILLPDKISPTRDNFRYVVFGGPLGVIVLAFVILAVAHQYGPPPTAEAIAERQRFEEFAKDFARGLSYVASFVKKPTTKPPPYLVNPGLEDLQREFPGDFAQASLKPATQTILQIAGPLDQLKPRPTDPPRLDPNKFSPTGHRYGDLDPCLGPKDTRIDRGCTH